MARVYRSKKYHGFFLRQRGESWQGMVKIPGEKRYQSKTFSGPQAYAEAEKWAKDRAAELRLGIGQAAGGVGAGQGAASVAALGRAMVEEMRRDGLSEGHIHHLEVMLGSWASVVADLRGAGAGARLLGWYASQDLAPNTFNRYLMQGQRFFHWCERKGHLEAKENPLGALRPRRVPKVLKEQFTVDEVRHLVQQVDDHFQPLFAFLVYTGARIAEALAVHWEDFEVDGRGGGVILFRQRRAGTHKTGERVVPLAPELWAILGPRRGNRTGKVFSLYRGNANRRFSAFLEAYGRDRPGLTPHSCRHTFCGLMTATGESTAMVAQWVGHSGEKQTLHYAALASRQRASVEGWRRGELPFLAGWSEPVRQGEGVTVGKVVRIRQALRTGGKYRA